MNTFEFTPANVKATMKEVGAVSADLWQVAYEDLHIVPGFNVREHDADYKAHVAWLADSILANGYYRDKPMAGYVANIGGVNRIVVTDGHCRHEAIGIAVAKGAELLKIPVVVKPSSTSAEDLIVAMVSSNAGKLLTPYELGTVCKRLDGFGWDGARIAQRLSFSPGYVADLLFLQGCPLAVRRLVQEGHVAASTAIDAVKKHGDKAIDVLNGAVDKAVMGGKTKATAKHMEPTWKSEVKKAAPEMYRILNIVQNDEQFGRLHLDAQTAIENLLESLPEEPVA